MQIGVVFPQTELGGAVSQVRTYAEGVEALGYRHIVVYEHVVGADPAVHTGWSGHYDVDTTFHEPMVLLGYLAAVTSLELATGIVVLPQRQTVLAAKQAAEVDLLTGGRLRFGVGVGWNPVEYEALGRAFSDRGRRLEEQVALLRRLWTERTVTHSGPSERVTGAGIAPLPVQRPIPVWLGAQTERACERVGRLADGWFATVEPGAELDVARAAIDRGARQAGRDPRLIGMESRVSWGPGGADQVADNVARWRVAGATHVGIHTVGAGLATLDDHLRALGAAADALGLRASAQPGPGRISPPRA